MARAHDALATRSLAHIWHPARRQVILMRQEHDRSLAHVWCPTRR